MIFFYYKFSWLSNIVFWNDAKWNWLSEVYCNIILQTFDFFVDSSKGKQVIVTVLYTRLFRNQWKIQKTVTVRQQKVKQIQCYMCLFFCKFIFYWFWLLWKKLYNVYCFINTFVSQKYLSLFSNLFCVSAKCLSANCP